MISINTDSGVDIILEILRQSRDIKANIDNKEKDNALINREENGNSYSPRASLRSPDTDKDIMLSRKGHHRSQRKSDEAYHRTKKLIEGVLNRMTAQDYIKLSEEGFMAEDLTIEALTFAVKLIKDYSHNSLSKDKVSSNKKEDKDKTDKISEDRIRRRMEEENLPINNDSIERIKGALTLSESIALMDKKDILYLLNNELEPSIENLYKARFSKQSNNAKVNLSENEWNKLIPQVGEIVTGFSAEVDSEILKDARWLIENNIPLTKESMGLLSGLKDLKANYSKDLIFDKIINGMKEGVLPENVIPIENEELYTDAAGQIENTVDEEEMARLIEDVHTIIEDDIVRTVGSNRDITLKNILQHHRDDLRPKDEELKVEETKDLELKEKLSLSQQAKLATAKRQLEEIRLKMTLEAAIRLEKNGFHIETEALENIVERLRIQEDIYYKELYNQAIDESDEASLRLLQLTSESIEQLKIIPVKVLGSTLSDRRIQTVSGLLTSGRSIMAELDRAKESYEAMFTVPKSEYGDSIKKAFSNLDSLMEEMGIENTEYNRRALRILGYNSMEITRESIEEVKAYDLSVNNLIQSLNPGIAIQIIRKGINPLHIPIDELNGQIEELREQGYSSLDKYSSYLYKLEQKEGLTEAERKAYIGIYRLLYHIDKSDGAAIGALVKADQEVTLNHLLTALRINKKSGMDYRINDDFGSLSEISFDSESISDQLRAVFHNQAYGDMIDIDEEYAFNTSTQNEIQRAVIKELLNSLTPEKLDQLHNSIQSMVTKQEGEALAHTNPWETIGNMPTEQLLDYIKSIKTASSGDQTYYYERLKEMQEIYKNCDQAIRFLGDFKLPYTTNNLMMAGQLINNSGGVFKKLFGLIDKENDENEMNSQRSLKKSLELSDTLVDNETMTEAYELLEQEVKDIIEEKAIKDNIDSNSLTQLKVMGMQVHFLKDLSKREFYQIPIEASGRITNINLTIIRGKASGGKVTVTLLSDKLGSIRAEASLKESKLNGYISCDNIGSLKLIEKLTEPLKSVAQEEGVTIKQLNFCLQQASDASYTSQNSWDLEGDKSPDTERILYRLARAMIHMIRSAEEADSSVA